MTAVVWLPFRSPPLRSNDRLHWRAKAVKVAEIRLAAKLCAWRDIPVALVGPVAVTFVWVVTDKRRRDAGASSPTLKAALDGIVDAGKLLGDHSQVVVSETCRIALGMLPSCRVEILAIDVAGQHVSSAFPDMKAS